MLGQPCCSIKTTRESKQLTTTTIIIIKANKTDKAYKTKFTSTSTTTEQLKRIVVHVIS